MKINCIIFDCDGTLVDSEYLCNYGLEIILNQHGIVIDARQAMSTFKGAQLKTIITSLEKQHNFTAHNNFEKDYRKIVSDLFDAELTACTGVHEFLISNNLPRCVASSGPMEKIRRALSITKLDQYFEKNLFSSYEIQSWKPDPALFLHAADSMNITPAKCLVVEDSIIGVQAGCSAGMRTVLFDPYGEYSEDIWVDKISDMRELDDYLY